MSFLEVSAKGSEVSEYHPEAAIASVHTTASGVDNADWVKMVSLYDSLTMIRTSPIVALNWASQSLNAMVRTGELRRSKLSRIVIVSVRILFDSA